MSVRHVQAWPCPSTDVGQPEGCEHWHTEEPALKRCVRVEGDLGADGAVYAIVEPDTEVEHVDAWVCPNGWYTTERPRWFTITHCTDCGAFEVPESRCTVCCGMGAPRKSRRPSYLRVVQ